MSDINVDKIKNEPLVLIGTLCTIGIGAVATLLGQGFISEALAGKATEVLTDVAQLILVAAPLISAIIGRNFVYGPKSVEKIKADVAAGDGV